MAAMCRLDRKKCPILKEHIKYMALILLSCWATMLVSGLLTMISQNVWFAIPAFPAFILTYFVYVHIERINR